MALFWLAVPNGFCSSFVVRVEATIPRWMDVFQEPGVNSAGRLLSVALQEHCGFCYGAWVSDDNQHLPRIPSLHTPSTNGTEWTQQASSVEVPCRAAARTIASPLAITRSHPLGCERP